MTRRKTTARTLTTEERLRLFGERVKEMRELPYVKQGTPCKFHVGADSSAGTIEYEKQQPEEENLRSFLLLFRHFISKSEPVFIRRVFNDCYRCLTDEFLKTQLAKARDDWDRRMDSGPFTMSVRGEEFSPEYALDLWINGHYFHNDPDKAEALAELGMDSLDLAYLQLTTSLPGLTLIVAYIGMLVDDAFERGLFDFSGE